MRSPIPHKHARIEIIPLIDIMFFLLASFMMVSLSQVHMKGIKVNLPSQSQAQQTPPLKDYTSVRVTASGETYFDNVLVLDGDVLPRLMQLHQGNADIKVSISADAQATTRRCDDAPRSRSVGSDHQDRLPNQNCRAASVTADFSLPLLESL